MQTVIYYDPTTINIITRQRTEFPEDEHKTLVESILKYGLFHAPGVIVKDNGVFLVYGERRYRAIKEILSKGYPIKYSNEDCPDGLFPAVQLEPTYTAIDLKEIELEENLQRRDLNWQDKAKAISDLEALRTITENKPATLESLADETGKSTATISTNLKVAKYLGDPDVQKAKTLKDANKVIARKEKEQLIASKTEAFRESESIHTFRQGDCRDLIKDLPANEYDCIVTDPPYGIDMHKDQSWDGSWHEYEDTEDYCMELYAQLLPEWSRVSRTEAHLYTFCDYSKVQKLLQVFSDYNGSVDESLRFIPMYFPIIWNKGNIAAYPRPEHWPRKSYECIIFAIKGQRPHTGLREAVISIPQIRDQDHPAGKPAELYAELIRRSCTPGDKVLDCFCGQGTIFKAASLTSTIATGFEMEEKYANLSKKTLMEI